MSTTTQAIVGFEDLVNKHKVRRDRTCKSILADIEKVRLTKPNTFHQRHIENFLEERAKVLNLLADEYLKASMCYPTIDAALWDLKRNIQFTINIYDKIDPQKVIWEGKVKLNMKPLFTESAFGFWIHNDQQGIDRDVWARFFMEEHPAKLEKA